jgi:translation initiation factor IF-3
VPQVRCIDAEGNQIGIISTREALGMAQKLGMDLVEIAPNAQPPVCRVMNFGKYKYEQDKKDKMSKKHQTAGKVKEVQFHPNVGDHDYQTKVRHIREFIEEGHRVKVALFFRGRESAHQELGFEVVNRVIKDCQDVATAEQAPKLMGRAIFMLMTPRPGMKSKPKPAPVPEEQNISA